MSVAVDAIANVQNGVFPKSIIYIINDLNKHGEINDWKERESEHYNSDYFEWQRKIGMFGSRANSFKFNRSIRPYDTVVDFGCGGGFLLKKLKLFRALRHRG